MFLLEADGLAGCVIATALQSCKVGRHDIFLMADSALEERLRTFLMYRPPAVSFPAVLFREKSPRVPSTTTQHSPHDFVASRGVKPLGFGQRGGGGIKKSSGEERRGTLLFGAEMAPSAWETLGNSTCPSIPARPPTGGSDSG